MSAILQGKIAIVSGAGAGIGRAIAERFHAEAEVDEQNFGRILDGNLRGSDVLP